MTCHDVDELGAAYALGALEPDAERAVDQHLATCDEPHAELRDAIGAAGAVPLSLDPVEPTPGLRGRLMATIAETEQEHRPAPVPARTAVPEPTSRAEPASPPRRPWWALGPLPAGLAAAALAVVVGLGAWNVNLAGDLADRDAALAAVASADAAFPATGSAGSGWVFSSDGDAVFVAASLAELPAGRIYELWLIDDGGPVPVGVLEDAGDLVQVRLERDLGTATVFAVTIESERVEAPTSDPVLVATLES